MATSYDLNLIQGATFQANVIATDSVGNSLNLSGYFARGYVRETYTSTGILLNLNPTIDPSYISGIVNLNISGQTLSGVECTQGVYDLFVYTTGQNAVSYRFLNGYCNIFNEVTY